MNLSKTSELARVFGLAAIPPLPPKHYVRPVRTPGGSYATENEERRRVADVVNLLLDNPPHEFDFATLVAAIPECCRYDVQLCFFWILRNDKTIKKRYGPRPGTGTGKKLIYSRIPQEAKS